MNLSSSTNAQVPARRSSGKPDLEGAATAAESFLRELEVSAANEIDPLVFAGCLDIKVKEATLEGFEGCLLRMGSVGTILYSSGIGHPARVRFTVAHEIGHWILHPGRSQGFLCTEEDLVRYKGSPMEAEANAFAGALLIPRFLLGGGRSFVADDFLKTTLAAAEEFGASVMATSKRLLDLVPAAYLVVFSDGGRVRWSWSSRGAVDIFLRAGTEIDPDTTAFNCEDSSATALRIGLIENSGELWFPDDFKRARISVREQSFRLYQDMVMTFLEVRSF